MQQLAIKSKYSKAAYCLPDREQGFTLVELMAVVAVLAVLLTIGAPTFVDTIKNSRMRAETYAIRATLANARSEAMARRMPVVVCETSNSTSCATNTTSWNTAHLAFADADNDGVVDTGEDIFQLKEHNAPGLVVTFRDPGGSAASSVRFSSRGDSLNRNGNFTLCDDRGATEASAVILNNAGAVRFATDTNDDEIVEVGGSNVVCP